jgi:hypothetical protein
VPAPPIYHPSIPPFKLPSFAISLACFPFRVESLGKCCLSLACLGFGKRCQRLAGLLSLSFRFQVYHFIHHLNVREFLSFATSSRLPLPHPRPISISESVSSYRGDFDVFSFVIKRNLCENLFLFSRFTSSLVLRSNELQSIFHFLFSFHVSFPFLFIFIFISTLQNEPFEANLNISSATLFATGLLLERHQFSFK